MDKQFSIATVQHAIPAPSVHVPTESRFLFAHRGLAARAPENTMAAFRAAADAGATWLEMDVDILGDGTPVVLHDSSLDRTTDHHGSMYSITAADLPSIDAGSSFSPQFAGQRIPTFHEFIDFLNDSGMNANVELKGNEAGKEPALHLIDTVIEELERLDPERQIIISSFSPLQLAEFHRRAPGYAIGVLFEKSTIRYDWRTILEWCGAQYIHMEDTPELDDLISLPLKAGYGVNVWTVDNPGRARHLLAKGASGIFTNAVDELLHHVTL
ncbi:MAG: glycerophosphoryl diester phosphodiesterase [Ancrocorticia sp.]|jgi:glycerophosphoryl diester phosphodiesterase|nr:glycerophosphoryl diester phosphodiesterase [Ancrocorticia sp.]MCI1895939.1 glycerophosphoryl diester phosphodiesterase [Ancrocorticia sp.]MCI1932796.1 glycerophosphoryl diester phosphodiesterase [Ancrocorticia sp.]MCI2012651.1 glycerophosphoryl diester phosphodiesterase [Ancrocorticia sp.]MCI2029224.1 glycerophosphoryl diester phosphodiesterase [Ancrocorticia sp.]